jgi:hypothetical protein
MHAQHGVLSTLSMSLGPLAACEPGSRRPGHPHLEDHLPAASHRDSIGSGVRVQHQDPVDADDGHADDEGRHTACGWRAGLDTGDGDALAAPLLQVEPDLALAFLPN